jgi:hypothetical protein
MSLLSSVRGGFEGSNLSNSFSHWPHAEGLTASHSRHVSGEGSLEDLVNADQLPVPKSTETLLESAFAKARSCTPTVSGGQPHETRRATVLVALPSQVSCGVCLVRLSEVELRARHLSQLLFHGRWFSNRQVSEGHRNCVQSRFAPQPRVRP